MIIPLLFLLQSIMTMPHTIVSPLRSTTHRDTTDNIIVIHYDSSPDALTTIRYLKKTKNSYHYLISRNGTVYRLIDPKYEAAHVGMSLFRGHIRLNHYSIGICLSGKGTEPFTDQQYTSLVWMIKSLEYRYPDISNDKIVGHADVAFPFGRKHDPGYVFDWSKLFTLLKTDP